MDKTSIPKNSSFLEQLKQVTQNAVDYAASALRLLQAELASMTLSSVVFVTLIFSSVLAGITAFVLFSVALGIWLTHLTGGVGWSLLIMGGTYVLIAIGLGGYAIQWLKRIGS